MAIFSIIGIWIAKINCFVERMVPKINRSVTRINYLELEWLINALYIRHRNVNLSQS